MTVRDKGPMSDERLRLARLAQGQSQEELAKAANVTRQAISGLESGRWSPSLEVALSLARALHTTVEELFGGPFDSLPVNARLVPLDSAQRAARPSGTRLLLSEIAGDTIAFP